MIILLDEFEGLPWNWSICTRPRNCQFNLLYLGIGWFSEWTYFTGRNCLQVGIDKQENHTFTAFGPQDCYSQEEDNAHYKQFPAFGDKILNYTRRVKKALNTLSYKYNFVYYNINSNSEGALGKRGKIVKLVNLWALQVFGQFILYLGR